ncbi:MAG: cohesin domain-containing protein, partial [Thermoanaerobaculia bacterium]|nr:cohesin domain-containing protein [Thermoanaerobaculia bacterium]
MYGLLLSFGANAAGQSSCVFFQVGAAAAAPGETVRLPVSAREFEEMLIYQFPIVWNPADLQFIRTDMTGSPLQYMSFGATNAAAGQLRCVWYDFDVEGVSVSDDATLFTLEFKVLAGTPGFYPVSLAPQIPGFAFEILQTSGPQLPLLHKVGGVQVGGLPVSDLKLDAFCAQSGFCNTLAGGLNTGVSSGVPPYTYAWTGPNGYTSTDATPANLQAGDYALTVSDQNGHQLVAGASILPLWSGLSAWADSIGLDWCDQASGCALIRTSGGNPPYQWLWPDGATQQSRCDLASGNYAVTVTDASGCSRMVQFYVPGESKLKVETQLTYADCRSGQYGAASVTALNGLAPYTYQWSNGAQSATIDQVTGGKYTVTVTDAAGCQTTTSTEVKDYGTLDWSVYLFAQCSKDTIEAPGFVMLNGYDFETRARYPLTLQWSTGTRDIVAEYRSDSLGGLQYLPNGRYSVTVSDSDGCTVEVSDAVDCRLTPPALTHLNTRFYLYNKKKNGGIDSCIDVRVLDFTNLDTVHFSLDWKYAKFKEVKNFATPVWKTGITDANFKTGNSELEFSWKAPA